MGYLLIRNPHWLEFAPRFKFGAWHDLKRNVKHRQTQQRREKREDLETEVDRLLIKVKKEGLHSLTAGEKRTLQRATNQKDVS